MCTRSCLLEGNAINLPCIPDMTHNMKHTRVRGYTLKHTVALGRRSVWHEGIDVTVSQLIPGVLSDSRDPEGPLLLLRVQRSIRHLSPPLKQKEGSKCVCVSIFDMHASTDTFLLGFKSMSVHVLLYIFDLTSSRRSFPRPPYFTHIIVATCVISPNLGSSSCVCLSPL